MPSERRLLQYGVFIGIVALVIFQVVFALYTTGSVRLRYISWYFIPLALLWILPLLRPVWQRRFPMHIMRGCTARQARVIGGVSATIALLIVVIAVVRLDGGWPAAEAFNGPNVQPLMWRVHFFTDVLVAPLYLVLVAVEGFLYARGRSMG